MTSIGDDVADALAKPLAVVAMIVVATHGHSGVEHMLFGSTADRIVRNARCPVLTVRPETVK